FLPIFFFSVFCPPLPFSVFPYTTLFRSFLYLFYINSHYPYWWQRLFPFPLILVYCLKFLRNFVYFSFHNSLNQSYINYLYSLHRSEEHTSELQSRENLVCRLLLDKKITT